MKEINQLTDRDILHNAIRFSLKKAPRQPDGKTTKAEDFQRTKATFITCVKWLRENYKDSEEITMGEFTL